MEVYLMSPVNNHGVPALDERQLALLYREFAEEDRELAEEGMADYVSELQREDKEGQPVTMNEK
jgi:hypothetical protein